MATTRVCSIEGCSKPPYAKGWCRNHYIRWYRHDDPLGKRKLNDGRHKHPLYQIWKDMIRRCTNPNHDHSKRYVMRSIDVCPRWREDFWNFVTDMGDRPSLKHGIERLNNDGDYEPNNCCWATQKEQSRNRCTNRYLTVNGQSKLLSDWAEEVGIDRRTIANRLKWGWSDHDAVMKPIRPHKPYKKIR
jgi:hypothetical protein